MLKRQDFVNNVLDVFDYIDSLKRENELLKNAVPVSIKEEKKCIFHRCFDD